AGRDVAGDHRTGPGPRPVADVAWGDDHRVDPDECPVTDRRRVLARAVVVGGDGARPDVGPLADRRVSEVAHVVLLRRGAESRVLELGEVADGRPATDDAARPQVAVRPDGRLVLDD